jgi:PhzF family phenazine biosynthesis protein
VSAERGSRHYGVDVFSPRPGAGNALAVVVGAEALDAAQMQRIATWNNLAETTFLLPPTQAGADYRVRIFTTRQEIAFAGHPTIGSAHIARLAGLVPAGKAEIVQECQAGLLPVRCEGEISGGPAPSYSVRVPRSRVVPHDEAAMLLLDRALAKVERGALAPACVEGGRRWWLAELADEATVRDMKPDRSAILALARHNDALGLCVFARAAAGRGFELVVRAFPLGVGIIEDPASGAANGAIAAFLDERGALGALGNSFRSSQGREMGRDAELLLRIDGERQVWVGGRCRVLVDGVFGWQ